MLNRVYFTVLLAVFLSVGQGVSAETWRLEKGQNWKAVSAENDRYLLAVSEIKQLAGSGQTRALIKAFAELKKDYPKLAGEDFDAFVKAEILLSEGKFNKAGRAYEKFLADYPESSLYEVVLDRQFSIATAFLGGQKRSVLKVFRIRGYSTGASMMEKIADRSGEGPLALKATVLVAESLEKRGKFDEAYEKWSEVHSLWPEGQTGQGALLAMARCKHAGYRGTKYDISYLVSARSYYQNYKLKYPDDAERLNIAEKLEEINEQLAYKQFGIAEYYKRSENKQSANFYYRMVMEQWPGTKAAEMAQSAMEEKEPKIKKDEKWEKKVIKNLGEFFL